jgi:hypothetical protein
MPACAMTQMQVVHIIAGQGEMRVGDLTVCLEKAQSNISRTCMNLVEQIITHGQLSKPYLQPCLN